MIELSEEFYAQREASRVYDYRLVTLLDVLFGVNDEHPESSLGLSVLIGGAMIRGTAITRERWESEHVEEIKKSDQESHEMLAELLQAIFDSDEEQDADYKAEFPERHYIRRWLHFRDVTITAGGQSIKQSHFRVSIDTIQGWSIGY